MKPYRATSDPRALQLLIDRATEGLSSLAARALDDWFSVHPHFQQDRLDVAAAAIDLALQPPRTAPMPDALRDRVIADAARFLATRSAAIRSSTALRGKV